VSAPRVDPEAARVAGRHLEERLVDLLPVSPSGPPRELAVGRRVRDDDLLGALVEMGALSESGAGDWSSRLETAWSAPSRPRLRRDAELRRRARELLERLLAEVTPMVERARTEGWAVVTFGDDAFGGALEALRAVGVLDAREEWRWTERWSRALDEGREERSQGARDTEVVEDRRKLLDEDRECSPSDAGAVEEDSYTAVGLVAVVPPVELRTDGAVRVTCAELYADCVSIAWQIVVPQPEWRPGHGPMEVSDRRGSRSIDRILEVRVELTDDLGTAYRRAGPWAYDPGIEGASSTAAWSETMFVPPVPQGATRLEATVRPGDGTIAFDLPRRAEVDQ